MPPKRKPAVKDEPVAEPNIDTYTTNGRALRVRAPIPSAAAPAQQPSASSLVPAPAPKAGKPKATSKATKGKGALATATKGTSTSAKVTKTKKPAAKKTATKRAAPKDPPAASTAPKATATSKVTTSAAAATTPANVQPSRKTRRAVHQGYASPVSSPHSIPKPPRKSRAKSSPVDKEQTAAAPIEAVEDQEMGNDDGAEEEERLTSAAPMEGEADHEMSDDNTASDERPTSSPEQMTGPAAQNTGEEDMDDGASDERPTSSREQTTGPAAYNTGEEIELTGSGEEARHLTVEDLEGSWAGEVNGDWDMSGDEPESQAEAEEQGEGEYSPQVQQHSQDAGVEHEPHAEAEVAESVSQEAEAEEEEEVIDQDLQSTPREETPANTDKATSPEQDDDNSGSDNDSFDFDTDDENEAANAKIVDHYPYYVEINGRAYPYRSWWDQRDTIYNTNASAEMNAPAAVTPSRLRYKHGLGQLGAFSAPAVASPLAVVASPSPAVASPSPAVASPPPAVATADLPPRGHPYWLPNHIKRLRASRGPLVDPLAVQPVTPPEPPKMETPKSEEADGGRTFGLTSLFRSVMPSWLTTQLGVSAQADANAASPSEEAKARKDDSSAVTQDSPSAGRKTSVKKVNRPARDDRSRSPRRRDDHRADRRERDYTRSRQEPQEARGRKKTKTSPSSTSKPSAAPPTSTSKTSLPSTDSKAAVEKPAVTKSAEPRASKAAAGKPSETRGRGRPARPVNRPPRDNRSRSPRRGEESGRADRRERDYDNGSGVSRVKAKKAHRPSPDKIPAHRPGERGYGLVEEYFLYSDSDESMSDDTPKPSDDNVFKKPALPKTTAAAASTPPPAARFLDDKIKTTGRMSYSLHGDMTIGQRRRIHRPSRSERRYRMQHGYEDPIIQHRDTVRALYTDPFGTTPLGESKTSFNRTHHLKRIQMDSPLVYTGEAFASPGDVGYRTPNIFAENERRDRKVLRRQAEEIAKRSPKSWSVDDYHVIQEGQRRLGHVAGTGMFTVPEYDSDEEDSSLLEDEPVAPTPTPKTSAPAKNSSPVKGPSPPARTMNVFAAAALQSAGQAIPDGTTFGCETRSPSESAPASKPAPEACTPSTKPALSTTAPSSKSPRPASAPATKPAPLPPAPARELPALPGTSNTMNVFAAAAAAPPNQPPPPPTPAHAQLPATPQLPERDTVAIEKAALERARAKYAKHKPANPSRLQNESRLSSSPATSPRTPAAQGPMADSLLTRPSSPPLSPRRYSNPHIDGMDERVALAIYAAIEQHMEQTPSKRYATEDQRFEDYCIAVEAREQRIRRSRAVQAAVDEAKKAFTNWDNLVEQELAVSASPGA
ncbi:hypothetical protein K490DRAFT_54887 [Saccharata proteae CBS 121410]|uniref:Uncharacterized protein n=1 Tax=Saccharata proteae CBS 121410 TaxID=1314787 RepID=A0A6A5YEM9_9PEZI|nr:hypothetical protein K490DRAFT_54887 [Saccharata proteae CBS 121410]